MEKGTPYNAQFVDKADRLKEEAPRPPGLHHTPPVERIDTVEQGRSLLDELERKERIEERARAIVDGARHDQYGGPEDSFERIARLWNAHLQNRGIDATLSAGDVALMMDLMKTARLVTAPGHRDSIVDKIGYTIAYAKAVGVET